MIEGPPDDLSPRARELFRVARDGALPGAGAREQSVFGLAAATASGTRAAEVSTPSAGAARGFRRFGARTRILLAAAAVFVTVGSAAAVHRLRIDLSGRSDQSLPGAGAVAKTHEGVAPSAPVPVVPIASAEGPPSFALEPPSVERESRASHALPPAHADEMEDELSLMRNARTALATHRSADALRFVAEDARRFPRGAFREERAYTSIRALCDVGRSKDAHAEGERFLHQWPTSVYAAGVRRSCAFAGDGTSAGDSLTGSRSLGH
jgi:hypothetical protein